MINNLIFNNLQNINRLRYFTLQLGADLTSNNKKLYNY